MQPIVSPWYLYLMNACDMLHLAFMFSFGVCTLKGLFDLFLPNKIPQRLVNESLKYFADHADICDIISYIVDNRKDIFDRSNIV